VKINVFLDFKGSISFVKLFITGFTQVVNSPGPFEIITTATDFFFIAVNQSNL